MRPWIRLVLGLACGAAACGHKEEGANPTGNYDCTTSVIASTCPVCSIPGTTTFSLSSEGSGYTLGTYWSGLQVYHNNFTAVHDGSTSNPCTDGSCCNAYSQDVLVFAIDVDKFSGTWTQVRGSSATGALCDASTYCVCSATVNGFR